MVVPLNVINQSRLQEQIPFRQQVVTDEVLVGPHGHAVTDAQGAQHVQNLQQRGHREE